jgi:hypothetical protein
MRFEKRRQGSDGKLAIQRDGATPNNSNAAQPA